MKRLKLFAVMIVPMLLLSACTPQDNSDETVKPQETQSLQSISEAEPVADTAAAATSVSETAATEAAAGKISELVTAETLAGYFDDFDEAAMLISDGDETVILNEALVDRELPPFSTFKIPNSLIALEEGVITPDNSSMKWDGTVHSREEINQDQTLDTAFKHSCVWYYQELARRIGNDAMQAYLDRSGYGNCDISGGIDQFWLGSSLQITPRQQLDFVRRMYYCELPFSPENIDYVKTIMAQEGYPVELYGKTGSSGEGLGWFTGYVMLEQQPYFFTVVITGEGASGLNARDIAADIFTNLQDQHFR